MDKMKEELIPLIIALGIVGVFIGSFIGVSIIVDTPEYDYEIYIPSSGETIWCDEIGNSTSYATCEGNNKYDRIYGTYTVKRIKK